MVAAIVQGGVGYGGGEGRQDCNEGGDGMQDGDGGREGGQSGDGATVFSVLEILSGFGESCLTCLLPYDVNRLQRRKHRLHAMQFRDLISE